MSSDDSTGDVFDAPRSDDTDSEYVYDDPDELHRVRRLRQIHDARERFNEVRLRGRERLYDGAHPNFGREQYRAVVATVALEYVRELEPIVRRADADLLERTVAIKNQTLTLAQLLDRDGRIRTTDTSESFNPDTGGTNTETTTRTETMDSATALRVARLCDDFLADVMPAGISTEDTSEWEI